MVALTEVIEQPSEFVTVAVYVPATVAVYVAAVAPDIAIPSKFH